MTHLSTDIIHGQFTRGHGGAVAQLKDDYDALTSVPLSSILSLMFFRELEKKEQDNKCSMTQTEGSVAPPRIFDQVTNQRPEWVK